MLRLKTRTGAVGETAAGYFLVGKRLGDSRAAPRSVAGVAGVAMWVLAMIDVLKVTRHMQLPLDLTTTHLLSHFSNHAQILLS